MDFSNPFLSGKDTGRPECHQTEYRRDTTSVNGPQSRTLKREIDVYQKPPVDL